MPVLSKLEGGIGRLKPEVKEEIISCLKEMIHKSDLPDELFEKCDQLLELLKLKKIAKVPRIPILKEEFKQAGVNFR